MGSQRFILDSRVAHVRELKSEVDRLKADNAALRGELESLRAHLAMATVAARDLAAGETLEIWDGWNLVLGSERQASGREELVAQARASGRRVWIVFDGPDERIAANGRVRVSYTGGTGEHRADRFICDFVRAAAYLGFADRVVVITHDRDFLRSLERLRRKLV